MPLLFRLIGIAGLLCIIGGLLSKPSKIQSYLYIAGGVLLTVYSIYLEDVIFVILQIVFTIAAAYKRFQLK